jgi:hypothetical protein
MSQVEQQTSLQDLAQQIATELICLRNEVWAVGSSQNLEHSASVIRTDGATVSLFVDGRHNARIEISGKCVRDCQGQYHPYDFHKKVPRISVAHNRGAMVIAKEIERRFLPDYLPLFALGKEQATQHDAAYEAMRTLTKCLADCAGCTVSSAEQDRFSLYQGYHKPSFDVQVGWHGDVTIKLENIAPELARQIMDLVPRIPKQDQ